MDLKQKLVGALPPITMPFDTNGDLVPAGLQDQIDFHIENGANAIVAGGSTGEGHTLSDEDFVASITAAHNATNGRVPFVAGLIVNSTRQAIQRVKMLDRLQIDALQITPVHYLFKPDAEASIAHFRQIANETDLPILIYNVVPWNYLDVELMLDIMAEVPGVIGMKQSGGDLESVSNLVRRTDPKNIVVTGTDALLYPAFTIGTQGAISALASAVPGAVDKLYQAVRTDDHATARDLHVKLGALWEILPHDNLPACVKYAQHVQGVPMFHPRAPMHRVSDELQTVIRERVENVLK